MSEKYYIHTFGCQMNVHDSEKIAGILSEAGFGPADALDDAAIIVLNTCSIREKAEQKFYSELGRLEKAKKNNPHIKIAVAGCIAQQAGNGLFKRFPYVDYIFGPDNIDNLQVWIKNRTRNLPAGQTLTEQRTLTAESSELQAVLAYNPEYHLKHLPVRREGKVRAWVSIMYGCNNFCAYCVVPYTRGRERSRTGKDIFNEVLTLAEQGFKEVTLLGQNVNSYGRNLTEKMDFPDLLNMIHEIEGLKRIRFVTSHPRDLSEKLITSMKTLPKLCGHVHLPVQSGSDKMLNLMNRGYSYEEYKYKTDMLKAAIPDIAITTDIITGFPGETEEDHQGTINALTEIGYDGIFAFKYSKRPGTKALQLPDHVDEEIKSRRLSEILMLQEGITYRKNKMLEGKVLDVLVEGMSETDRNKLTGRTGSNKVVNFYGNESDIGKFVNIRISEAKQHSLFGEKVGS